MERLSRATPSRVRPKLGSDAVFLPAGAGAFFRNDGRLFVREEEGTYELMRRIAGQLTGEHTLEEVCRAHDPSLRAPILRLVQELLAQGILRDARRAHRRVLSAAVRARFAPQIELIAHLGDPEGRFERFRASRVLLAGWGASFAHCGAALVRNGLQTLWLCDREQCGRIPERVAAEAEALRSAGIPARVGAAPEALDRRPEWPRGLSLILYVADRASLPDLVRAGRRGLQEACGLLPAFVADDQGLVGPLVRSPGCWVCAFLRIGGELCGESRREASLRQIRESGGLVGGAGPVAEARTREVGGDAAFEAFKALAGGLRPELEAGLSLQTFGEAGAITARFVPFTRHGCTGLCNAFASQEDRRPC